MFTRTRTTLIVGALLLIPALAPGRAAAQADLYRRLAQVTQHSIREALPPAAVRGFTPVIVRRIDGAAVVRAGETAAFSAVTNAEAATLPLRTRWNFGSSSTAAGLHAAYRFDTPGTYTVTFRLWNRRSHDEERLTVTVLPREQAGLNETPANEPRAGGTGSG